MPVDVVQSGSGQRPPRPGAFPLSAAQRGIWYAQHLAREVPISIAQYVEIDGPLDVDLLRQCSIQMSREFGTGYLRVAEFDDEPWQWIDETEDPLIRDLDFSHEADPRARALEWMTAEYSTPIDLNSNSMLTAATLKLGPDQYFWYMRVHHIAADGFAGITFVNRVAELYTAAVNGTDPAPSKAGTLEAVVAADTEYRASDKFTADGEYWAEHLRDLPEPVSLAGRTAPPNAHPRLISGALPDDTNELLNAASSGGGAGVAPVIIAAFAAYVARLTATTELTLSLPVAARTNALLKRSGGMVANIVPLRLSVDSGVTIADLIRSTQLELVGALRRPRYRQEDMFRDLGYTGDDPQSFGPTVNLMMFESRVVLGPTEGRVHVLTSGLMEDLFLNVYPGLGDASTHLDFQANPNLYSAADLSTHHTRFVRFLHRFLSAGDDTFVRNVSVLSDEEREALVPARGKPSAPAKTLPEILADGVAKSIGNPAVTMPGRSMSYDELDRKSSQLARLLIERGARPETHIVIAIARSIESVLAVWAVVKTGAAFVPVDPKYPADRILHMITDCGSTNGITLAGVRDAMPGNLNWLLLDDVDLDAYSDAPITDADRLNPVRLQNTAYVIYTSGSTGLPKGVRVTHGGLTNLIEDRTRAYGIKPSTRMSHAYSPSFDGSLEQFLVCYGNGATFVVVPAGVYGGDQLATLIEEESIYHIDLPPAMLSSMDPAGVHALKSVVVGGDVCRDDLVSRWQPGRTMHNTYGPTEVTIVATATTVVPGSDITIGGPMQGVTAVVLDRLLQPVPLGVAGELYLGGPAVARCYANLLANTATRFIADPFNPGATMYRTGDVVKWVHPAAPKDGACIEHGLELAYIGRSDFQLKIRGFRVELGEVDAALTKFPAVENAVTIGAKTPAGNTVLASYVAPLPGHTVDPDELTDFVAEFLPGHMVPSTIMILDALPLSAVGKVDRKQLPAPVFTSKRAGRAPTNPTEELLAGMFADVLGLDSVGIDDSFFALGGDSIVAIQFVSRAKAAGLTISTRDVFERKTVAALAEIAGSAEPAVVLEELPGGGVGEMPLSPVIALMTDAAGPYDRYSQSALIELPADVDRDGLENAVNALVQHHDMLHAVLRDGTLEVVAEAAAVELHEGTDVERELQAAADRLDPAAGKLVAATIVRRSDGPDLLWLVIHHLAVDGVSWRILLPDLAMAYNQVPLQPVSTSFRRWVHGLAEVAESRRDELPRWDRVLSGTDDALGVRAFDPVVDVVETAQRLDTVIPADVTASILTVLPERFHGGVNDGLLTALALAVAQFRARHGSRQTDVLLQLEGHGREEAVLPGADISRTVGWFTTVYPVRLDVTGLDLADAFAGGATAGAAVKAVKEQLRALPDNGIGYGMLRYLDPVGQAQLAGRAAPQISFNYLGRTGTAEASGPWMPTSEFDSLVGTSDPRAVLPALIDINAIATDTAGGAALQVSWSYAGQAISAAEVQEIADLWSQALDALARHAQQPTSGGFTPSDFALVSTTQSDLDRWAAKYPNMVDVWPLSPLQFGLLFHSIYDSDASDAYTVQTILTLSGTVDARRMRGAGQAVIDRNDNLRAAFVETDDGPRQVILANAELGWHEVDLRQVTDADKLEKAFRRHVEVDAGTRFDLSVAPLLRLTLIRMTDDEYKLLITNHHIVLDGWSTPLLVQQLMALYAGHDLPLARSYKDYLSWLDEQSLEHSLSAWKYALAGVDNPTRAVPTLEKMEAAEADQVSLKLTADQTAAINALAKELGVTVNTMIQVAWALGLATLTGRTDVVFGGTVSGRPAQLLGVEDMIGLFINSLPVRVNLDPGETVTELLIRVQKEQAALLEHQHVGLSDIHQAVGLPELFDTLTVFESYPIDTDALAEVFDVSGMRVTGFEGTDATPYPLSLLIIPHRPEHTGEGERFEVVIKFLAVASGGTAELDKPGVQRILDRFVRLLTDVVAKPEARVATIQPCDSAEIDQLAPVAGLPDVELRTLPEIFAAGAAVNPNAIAVTSGDMSLTYAELDAWSNRLARVLLRRNVGPEVFVALALTRSMESVVAIWAVAKSGAAFAPMDPNHPPERIEHMITDSKAPIGITITATGSTLPGSIDWLLLDDINTMRRVMTVSDAPITDAERGRPILIDQTAYLIYTSGSTGKPKAVLLSHRGLANLVVAQREEFGTSPQSNVLQVASPSFDASVSELLLAHATGARLVVAAPETYGGPQLESLLREERVTTAVITPSALASMEPHNLPDLAVLAVAGEASGPELVERWSPDRLMLNHYGPTEFSIWATGSGHMRPGEVVTIGGPIRGARLLVLDTWLRPVPIGSSGELYLAGRALARGYFNRTEMNASRFIANPYGQPGERMYRTGDMVRWVRGNRGLELEYMGRSDFQVKIRGLRIELGEIDAVLVADDEVAYAATLGVKGPSGATVLVSYVLPEPGVQLDTERLRTKVASHLPGYMVPSMLVILDKIPLTPVGKLDRKALPVPDFRARPASTYLAPRTAVEQTVVEVFGAVLGFGDTGGGIGIDESFFDLGGNSLMATRVIARINSALGSSIALRDLFDAPTAAQLSSRINPAGVGSRAKLTARPRPDRIPLSLAQQRMWVVNQLDPTSGAYNIAFALRLTGALDVDAFSRALGEVIARHESLRTVFPSDSIGPRQVIIDAKTATPVLRVEHVPEGPALRAAIEKLVATGIDVTQRTPLRVALYQPAPDVHVLVLVVHHIAADGVSVAPLAADLMTAYSAPGVLEPLSVQYADFALWQREVLGDDSDPESLAAAQVDFWSRYLSGIPEQLDLPSDRPRPPVQSLHSADYSFTIGKDTHARMISVARSANASLFMLAHAALAAFLGRMGSTDDVVIGTPVAGRGEAALDPIVGMFVNTLALRTTIRPGMSFRDFLTAVRTADLEAFANADVPFERLVEALKPERSAARHPLFQVALALENFAEASFTLPNLTVEVEPFTRDGSEFDLSLSLKELTDANGTPAGLAATFTYATDMWDEPSMQSMAERFVHLLDSLIGAPETPIGRVPLITPNEQHTLVPVAGLPTAVRQLVPEILADAVQRHRDNIALITETQTLTYAQLDAESNRLARRLIAAGAGPETFVALALTRSAELWTMVWAVLKSGAAFVPVDPKYPIERITHMLTDSGAVLGVTVSAFRGTLPDSVDWLVLDEHPNGEAYSDAPLTTTDLLRPIRHENPVWLIYTSGSTGLPKGVTVTHGGVASVAASFGDVVGVDETARVLQVASPSFDASLLEFFLAYRVGATLVVAPPTVFGGDDLTDLINRHSVTMAFITPSALSTVDPAKAPSLRALLVGGEALNAELVARWSERLSLFNFYGPTETTIVQTATNALSPRQQLTIGRPLRGAHALILDSGLQPVPPGVLGELYLSGDALARGYHARPIVSAERFVANPYGPPGDRMYRTGDLVRWTPDLRIEYIGRTDFQVKIRGLRIELGEIDAVLAEHESVDFATTLGMKNPAGAMALVAYVTAASGATVDPTALKDFAADRLPAHMVPSAIVVLAELPLTPVGKLDRKRLPEPDFGDAAATYVAPRNALEEQLAALFAEVLGQEKISVTDSFLAIGGDSIMAIQLASRAKAAGLEISSRQLFENLTVASLAEAMAAESSAPVAKLEEIPGGGVGDVTLTPVVKYMTTWPGTWRRFMQALVLSLPADVTLDGIESTIQAVVDHHDMLRAHLTHEADGWRLNVPPAGAIRAANLVTQVAINPSLGRAELHALANDALDTAVGRLDPANGILVQCVWLNPKLDDPDATHPGWLIFAAHHLSVDGVSWRIIVPDLITAWLQRRAGAPVELPPVGTSMRTWADALQREALRRNHELDFWKRVSAAPDPLLGIRPLDPATDLAQDQKSFDLVVSSEVTEAVLTTAPTMLGVGVSDGLLAALAVALVKWRARRGVDEHSAVIRLEGHGRQEEVVPGADLTRTVGWFTAIYPVLLDLAGVDTEGGQGVFAAARAIGAQLRTVPDKGVGYGLLRYLNPEAAQQLSGPVPGQVVFNYLGRMAVGEQAAENPAGGWLPVDDLGDLTANPDDDRPALSPVEVNAIVESSGFLKASITYASSLLEEEEVVELTDLWEIELEALAAFVRTSEARALADHFATEDAAARLRVSALDVWPLDVVLPIRSAGSGAPLFCVHPSSGMSMPYQALGFLVNSDRPIYGLQSPALRNPADSPATITEFAKRYVREIRSIQPEGPYHLLGWSYGGLVAHAIAAELRQEEQEIALLALLDADTSDFTADMVQPFTVGEFLYELGPVLGIDFVPADATTDEAVELIARNKPELVVDAPLLERLTAVYNAVGEARLGHERPVVDCDAVYFTATVAQRPEFGHTGWSQWVTGTITNYDIAATHEGLTAPEPLGEIAQLLERHFADHIDEGVTQ